jgi:large subunit ribosomal protein L20
MPRTKGGAKTRRRHKRWQKLAKGYWGRRKSLYRQVRHTVQRALRYAWRDRRQRKREFRRLWIARIAAAAKQAGMSYSKLMGALSRAGVELDRKVLADLAVYEAAAFEKVVDLAKRAA